MSVQSEIDRLNGVKREITSILDENGTVVPPDSKLDVYPELFRQALSGSTGGYTGPLNLTGFQPDPDYSFPPAMKLDLTDEQYDAVMNSFQNGFPIRVEGFYLVYPISDASDFPEFGAVPTSGLTVSLWINGREKYARFIVATVISPPAIGDLVFSALDDPIQVDAAQYKFAFDERAVVEVGYPTLNDERIIMAADSKRGSEYIFASSSYRLTIDYDMGVARLSLIENSNGS